MSMLEIWIEEAKVNAPKLNRQQLESLYISALRVGLSFEKRTDELFDRIDAQYNDISALRHQLLRLGITPCTDKEQCKVIQMTAR